MIRHRWRSILYVLHDSGAVGRHVLGKSVPVLSNDNARSVSTSTRPCYTPVRGQCVDREPPPEPPDNCCGTGCANCVWISYLDQLVEYYQDGGDSAIRAVGEISDPSIRAFVKMELLAALRKQQAQVQHSGDT